MRRAFFTFVAAASAVVFVATLALWVRGRRTMDHFWLVHGDEGSELIRSAAGRITVRHTRPNARNRITMPRRLSHWSCRVGSQLSPKPSRLHWEWRFITYEGMPPPTAAEERAARAAIDNARALREELGLGPIPGSDFTRRRPPSADSQS